MSENSQPAKDPPPILLQLPKTGLQVEANDLVKVGARNAVVMRLPLAEIESLAFRTTFEPMSLVFIGTGIGLGLVGYFASTVDWLSWVLYISGVLIIGFGIIGWIGYRIFIHAHGEAIGIACNDLPEEGRGFVISVRLLLRASRQKTL